MALCMGRVRTAAPPRPMRTEAPFLCSDAWLAARYGICAPFLLTRVDLSESSPFPEVALMIPNFFIIGAPKCGTTAMASYLGAHPNVFMCSPKEPHYFSTDINWQVVGNLTDYLRLFAKAKKHHLAIGEGSVFYLFSHCAVENILKFNPDARFIVMCRNPVELVVSLYAENRKSGAEEFADFEQAWRAQGARQLSPPVRNPNALQYEAIAKTGGQLARLYEVAGRDRVLVILFEDFVKDPRLCYLNVLKFLSLQDDHRMDFPIHNEKHVYRSALFNRMITSVSDFLGLTFKFRRPLKAISDVIRTFNYASSPTPALRPKFRQELISVFRDDISLLGRLLNRDLSSWLR